jgi:hypothetical protein
MWRLIPCNDSLKLEYALFRLEQFFTKARKLCLEVTMYAYESVLEFFGCNDSILHNDDVLSSGKGI